MHSWEREDEVPSVAMNVGLVGPEDVTGGAADGEGEGVATTKPVARA